MTELQQGAQPTNVPQEKFEVVDTHFHLWDLARNPGWYPSFTGPAAAKEAPVIGDITGLCRNYLLQDYRLDTAAYRVSKLVHVSATTGSGNYVHESRWVARLLAESGLPHALVGAIDPSLPLSLVEAELDAQWNHGLLRGVRVTVGLEPQAASTAAFLRMLRQRGLKFELVAHPHNMLAFAHLLQELPGLVVVLEHMGWPTTPEDSGHFQSWREGISALAVLPNVHCKLSGLPMSLHRVDAGALRPWVEACIEAFGVDRCLFASNFPVDRLFGSFDALYDSYRRITDRLGRAAQHKLFVANAERIYRI